MDWLTLPSGGSFPHSVGPTSSWAFPPILANATTLVGSNIGGSSATRSWIAKKTGEPVNPLRWKSEHQLALVIAALIGAIVGTMVGYFADALAAGAGGFVEFGQWSWTCRISHGPEDCSYGAASTGWWSATGAAVGAGITYVRHLMQTHP